MLGLRHNRAFLHYLNVSKKKRKYRKTLESESIKTNNIIKLWIKEGKTIAQQTAAGLTIPLTGFLTNSKTTFNTIYNLLNDDFYGALNPNIKSTNLLNKSVYKVKTNRLEKINFQKSSDSFLNYLLEINLKKMIISYLLNVNI